MSDLKNEYNMNTPENATALVLFVTAYLLIKEGYKQEHVQGILKDIGDTVAGIVSGQLKVTPKGILFNTKHINTNTTLH